MSLYRVAYGVLLLFVCAVAISTQYIDYKYLAYVASRELRGQHIENCLDLPAKYWRLYEKCWDGRGVPRDPAPN